MNRTLKLLFLSVALLKVLSAQNTTVRIATYNVLNFPGSTGNERISYFREIIDAVDPDILIIQEMLSQSGVNLFLNQGLNHNGYEYFSAPFYNGPDTDNILYYRAPVTLISTNQIPTSLRDISAYTVAVAADTFTIYSVHLKASQGSSNEQQRLNEVSMLNENINTEYPFIVTGDFNIYKAQEPAYGYLLNEIGLIDPLDEYGNWHNNSTYSWLHTQSPRTTSFGGGATGGIDDRFDMILVSPGFDITYGSYTAFGNDGNHFNQAVNNGTNTAVPEAIADALHAASDHLPVYADFIFSSQNTSVIVDNDIGWNMVGLPVIVDDSDFTLIFPNAISGSLYGYDGSYYNSEVLETGSGYWLRFANESSRPIEGQIIEEKNINLRMGWNLITGISFTIDIENIIDPNNLITPGAVYGFNGTYTSTDILVPGKGYWLHSAGEGSITILFE